MSEIRARLRPLSTDLYTEVENQERRTAGIDATAPDGRRVELTIDRNMACLLVRVISRRGRTLKCFHVDAEELLLGALIETSFYK